MDVTLQKKTDSPQLLYPRPNVGSAMVRLIRHESAPVKVRNKKKMFGMIRAAVNQRRKTFANSLGNAPDLGISKERAASALEKLRLAPAKYFVLNILRAEMWRKDNHMRESVT